MEKRKQNLERSGFFYGRFGTLNHMNPDNQSNISCEHCNYNLSGIDLQGSCPECGKQIISKCFRCEYSLEGLDPAGPCPECGLPIEASIGRGELAKADPSYLKSLHKGVFIVQTAIILYILALFGVIGVTFSAGMAGGITPLWITLLSSVVGLLFSIAMMVGWWMFSAPQSQYTGSYTGSEARKLVRIMIIVAACFSVISFPLAFFQENNIILLISGLLGLVSLLISLVRFIAEMFYIRWMAPLIRNKKVYDRSKLLMWLGPVLMTVGILLVGLGPIIALVLYWNMLDLIRKDLKAIRSAAIA